MAKVIETIQFNTGRQYSKHGQRITAALWDDGTVVFRDHDRLIEGQYTARRPALFSDRTVMAMYDKNKYRMADEDLGWLEYHSR